MTGRAARRSGATPDGRAPARTLKRALDIVGAASMLVLLGSLVAGTALLVLAIDGRPVLFRHQRPGLGGKPFTMLKFRTMRHPRADESWRMDGGQRVTRLGRILRSSSLDELPELWNVLRGDMSLVGPRPLLMEHLAAFTPEERRRMEVRPGLTGWAIVNGRHTTSFEERLRLDVWYVDHWSLVLDARILAMTAIGLVRHADVAVVQDPTVARLPERFERAEASLTFGPDTRGVNRSPAAPR